MQANVDDSVPDLLPPPDSGQASVLLVLMLSTFLLGVMAFAVDLTGLWFHRQSAQSAADAACLAGASDMLALRAGVTPPSAFAVGTDGNCAANSSAPLCRYAAFNGYNGTGLTSSASNSVSYKFPSSVSGATSPGGSNPYLQVSVAENVKTYFAGFLHGSNYQTISASSTCGIALVRTAPPVAVLNPTVSGSFTYTGGGELDIVGGPSRGLQVNSSSPTAVYWGASAIVNTSAGGPKQTGSDVAIFGGPAVSPTNGSSNGFSGGTTGHWSGNNLPIADPFANVGPPTSIKSLAPAYGVGGKQTQYHEDGCPETNVTIYTAPNYNGHCLEFSPGYYPAGITLGGTVTAILDPGIYYFGNSLNVAGSATIRMAQPTGYQQTDGVMLFFLNGGLAISGCSGCNTSSHMDNVPSTALTCDGSPPDPAIGMPSTIDGNILWGQCANNGTYWDAGNDTSDSRGTPGNRGILLYTDHANTISPQFTGSGSLAFSGALYLHSNSYATILSLSGGAAAGTYMIGEIVADKISLTGSGKIKLALNPAKTLQVSKVALLR